MTTTRICALCGGEKSEGMITFAVDLQDSLIVIRNVPATVCSLCGHEWLSDQVAASVEQIAYEARRDQRQVEITQYHKVA